MPKRATPDYNLAVIHEDIASDWDYKKNKDVWLGVPEDYTPNSNQRVWWKCSKKDCGHSWKAAICSRAKGTGCSACAGRATTPKNNLAAIHEDVANEWDYKKNKAAGLGVPEDYTPGSGKKVFWKCSKKDCGHSWKAAICSRTNKGSGCSACTEYGFNPSKEGFFYVSAIKELRMIKFGVTNRKPETRIREQERDSGHTHRLLKSYRLLGEDAWELEQAVKARFIGYEADEKFDGSTETIPGKEYESLMIFIEDFLEEMSD